MPLLPALMLQAKRVRARVPRLPEAVAARSGTVPGRRGGAPLRLVMVGESTAVGVGVQTLEESMAGHLPRRLSFAVGVDVDWTVLGGTGLTAQRVTERVRSCHEVFDTAVILLGVNDVFRLTPLRDWRRHMRELVELLETSGCKHVVCSSVPPVGFFPALPQPLRSVLGVRAALLNDCLVEIGASGPGRRHCPVRFERAPHLVAEDGLHPSAAGYAAWAEQLCDALLSLRDCPARGKPGGER